HGDSPHYPQCKNHRHVRGENRRTDGSACAGSAAWRSTKSAKTIFGRGTPPHHLGFAPPGDSRCGGGRKTVIPKWKRNQAFASYLSTDLLLLLAPQSFDKFFVICMRSDPEPDDQILGSSA